MIAFSFPVWRCKGCRNHVEWADAVALVVDGKCDGFAHVECVGDE